METFENIPGNDELYKPASEYIEVENEFTVIKIRKVLTRNGVKLEISSPKRGLKKYLDAMELEALTWSDERYFSRLLRTPWGPED